MPTALLFVPVVKIALPDPPLPLKSSPAIVFSTPPKAWSYDIDHEVRNCVQATSMHKYSLSLSISLSCFDEIITHFLFLEIGDFLSV